MGHNVHTINWDVSVWQSL